jgi:apolipoprotein N-acyltransferase
MNPQNSPTGPSNWKKSLLWLAVAVVCFHAAYTSLKYPVAGLMIFGYALALIQLADQPNVRRAFYFGLATGFLCYAPQLFFFWRIFSAASVVLWLVLAFWIGLFTAIVCGSARRWGKVKTAWLIPIVWTGIEYFRSELYYLKFSWMNIGYAMPFGDGMFGMYGTGLLMFTIAAAYLVLRWKTVAAWLFVVAVFVFILWPAHAETKPSGRHGPFIVGIQMEFPPSGIIPQALYYALVKNPEAQIFVLSEYTLDGPAPDALKSWCREHERFLVVGGKDLVTNDVYYNTAFVIGTNGDIVFKQVKSVPIQFFKDGLPAPEQKVWNSPWGKIGICVCYDLSYTRVTDGLIRQGAQLLIVPTMDVADWGRHQHELHARVAPVRAAEYGVPIFRVCSSGISQAVNGSGRVVAQAPMPGNGDIIAAQLRLPMSGTLPLDRYLAPLCSAVTGFILAVLLLLAWNDKRFKPSAGKS